MKKWWGRIRNDSTSRLVLYVLVLGIVMVAAGVAVLVRALGPQQGGGDNSGFAAALLLLTGGMALKAWDYARKLVQIAAEKNLSEVEKLEDLKPASKLAAQAAFVVGLLLIAAFYYQVTKATAPTNPPAYVGGLLVALVTVGFFDAFRDLRYNLRKRELSQDESKPQDRTSPEDQKDPDQARGDQQGQPEQGQADPEGQDEQATDHERGQ